VLPEKDINAMACHYSKPHDEVPCVGWLAHQVGPSNNLALRLIMLRNPVEIVLDGEQHETFEDTLL